MADQIFYGSLKPQYFVLIDSTGARVASHTWVSGDANLHIDGGSAVAVHTEITHVANGLYKWTPSVTARTQGQTLVLLLTDSGGSSFVDNTLIYQTGGHASAYFDAGA